MFLKGVFLHFKVLLGRSPINTAKQLGYNLTTYSQVNFDPVNSSLIQSLLASSAQHAKANGRDCDKAKEGLEFNHPSLGQVDPSQLLSLFICTDLYSPSKLLSLFISTDQNSIRVPHGLVVKCLTRNPGVLGSSLTGSSGFFRGRVLGQDTSEPSLVLVKPRKS